MDSERGSEWIIDCTRCEELNGPTAEITIAQIGIKRGEEGRHYLERLRKRGLLPEEEYEESLRIAEGTLALSRETEQRAWRNVGIYTIEQIWDNLKNETGMIGSTVEHFNRPQAGFDR